MLAAILMVGFKWSLIKLQTQMDRLIISNSRFPFLVPTLGSGAELNAPQGCRAAAGGSG